MQSNYVTYYRVSTAQQGRSGLGLEAQREAVQAFLARGNGHELASFVEVESGKVNSRPQLSAALLRCRQTRATLLVAKLDRLSRNAAFLLSLRDSDVRFQALDIPEANTLTLGVMAILAQHERELISERTKAALAARKARGLPLGTPRDLSAWQPLGAARGLLARQSRARAHAESIAPQIEEARSAGCATLAAVAAWLNERGILTPRGCRWTPAAVLRTERRVGQLT